MIVNALPVKDFCRYSFIQCILVDVCVVWFLGWWWWFLFFHSPCLILYRSFYLFVFILFLACFWYFDVAFSSSRRFFFLSCLLSYFGKANKQCRRIKNGLSVCECPCVFEHTVRSIRVESLFDYSNGWWFFVSLTVFPLRIYFALVKFKNVISIFLFVKSVFDVQRVWFGLSWGFLSVSFVFPERFRPLCFFELSFFSLSASVFRYIMTNKFHVGLLSRCVSY